MAWVYVKYAPAGSPLYVLEKDARLRGVGLWADPRRLRRGGVDAIQRSEVLVRTSLYAKL